MLLRAHRLQLFRLRAGLPSYLPQQKLRTELPFQQRGPRGARNSSGNAFGSDVAFYEETVDAIRASSAPHAPSLDSLTCAIPATTNDKCAGRPTIAYDEEFDNDIPNTASIRKPSVTFVRSPQGSNRSGTHEQIGILVYYNYGPGGRLHKSLRNISKNLWTKEMAHRNKSLYSDPDSIRRWKDSCAAIAEAKTHKDISQIPQTQLLLTTEDETLLEKLKADPMQSFRKSWAHLTKTEKIGHWERLSLWLLYHSPELVPHFLRITCDISPRPVFSCVSVCILYLQNFYPDLVDESLITTCLHPRAWPILIVPQKGIRVYLRAADRNGVSDAWRLTHKHLLHITPQSILCFMNRFTKFKDIDRALGALQILQRMKHPLFKMSSKSVIHHCCKLLMLDEVVVGAHTRNFRILPQLLKLGVKPTRDLMNVVLTNAYKSGDPLVGQSILDFMKQQKIEPDSFTYLTLLKSAVGMGDREHFESLLQEIQTKKELQDNPWLSSKILHGKFVFHAKQAHQQNDPEAVFDSMLDTYSRLHDITPLKELSIIPHHYTPPEGSGNTPPSAIALYIMIAAYLRCMKKIDHTERVWFRFKALVTEGHEIITPLAATDHTYNEFLSAFRLDHRGVRHAVLLVGQMIHHASRDASSERIKGSKFEHAAPTVRTWTLLLSCFLFQKQPLAVEKVRAMMNKHGVEYSLWTWNMIINNYANSQNVPALAQAIKDMEREGVAPDKYTLDSLRYLRDPERLWVAIDELERARNISSLKNSTAEEHLEEKDGGSLLEQGLRRLKDNMRAKS
ncbi:hypothetical protein BJX70DRAFT_24417 [Aspergillus crustosus]